MSSATEVRPFVPFVSLLGPLHLCQYDIHLLTIYPPERVALPLLMFEYCHIDH